MKVPEVMCLVKVSVIEWFTSVGSVIGVLCLRGRNLFVYSLFCVFPCGVRVFEVAK
jgi:hypothetical protein